MKARSFLKNPDSRPGNRGAAAAEFALMLPVLLVFLVWSLDFCRMFSTYTVVTECARNGALWACDPAAQSTSPYTSVTSAALADAGNLSPTPTVTSSTTATSVQVTVTYQFTPVTKYLGFSSYPVSRTIQMNISPP